MIETTRETRWHEADGSVLTLPPGTQGFILTKSHFHELEDEGLKIDLERAKRHYKKNERQGVFAYIERKYRWLDKGSYKRI